LASGRRFGEEAYSQGWHAGNFVFVTGTGPIGQDSKVRGSTIEEQTEFTINNIEAVLQAAGATLGDVDKVTVHLNRHDPVCPVQRGLRSAVPLAPQ
jgi:enamine deaminase RidA (YjgF/YER057c/UK114 family)